MSRAADKLTSLILALVVMALVWKLYKREDARTEGNTPENEAYSEHLESIEGRLDELSKLRRNKRLERVKSNGN